MAQLAIKGHHTRGNEVIASLEMLGGKNNYNLKGDEKYAYYTIDRDNVIRGGIYIYDNDEDENIVSFTLEIFEDKFPYKIGDKVKTIYDEISIVKQLVWSNKDNAVKYELEVDEGIFYFANELQPYKEEIMTKFKVGDKVRVKSLDWVKTESNKHAYYLTYDMLFFCGKVVTIQKIVKNIFSKSYIIEEDTNEHPWFDYMFEDEVVKEDNDIIKSFEIMEDKDNVKSFKTIADELCALYERKNNAYGNSFGDTYQKLGLISAVTRISDKYNRLCNLATNPNIDNLGESIEDTLQDLAAYSIMTLMEIRKNNDRQTA